MKYFLTFLSVAYLSSCVNIPIPPTGKDQGKLGAVQLKLSVSYIPNNSDKPKTQKQEKDASVEYAFAQFSKTLKDK